MRLHPPSSSIQTFAGPYAPFSNFHKVTVQLDGVEYPTVEHAYQAAKTKFPQERNELLLLCCTPGAAKKFGRTINLRTDWEDIKVDVMRSLLAQKFSVTNYDLADLLLSTGTVQIVEGNFWHDNFWGACFCKGCAPLTGQNWLGRLLQERREELRK